MPKNVQLYQALRDRSFLFPQCRALGLQFESAQGRKQILSVPWRADLVGDKEAHTIHGGVIATLIDTSSFIAVFAHLSEIESLATLDLRIDYLRPATARNKIFAEAECYRLTEQIAFVRTICFQTEDKSPIALGIASFIRTPVPVEFKGVFA